MNVCLLYKDKDWVNTIAYYDFNSIVKDLGLESLFRIAAKDLVRGSGRTMYDERNDSYLSETLKRVMRIPLRNKEELLYRQSIMKDCFFKESFVCELYELTGKMLEEWDKLGRKVGNKTDTNSVGNLITQIHVLRLFVDTLKEIKRIFEQGKIGLESEGLLGFYERLCEEFSEEKQEMLEKILEDVSFYTDVSDEVYGKNVFKSQRPKIMIDCGLGDGLKFTDLRLEGFETVVKRYTSHNGVMSMVQGYINTLAPDCVALQKNADLLDQAEQLVFQVVSYIMNCCTPFMNAFNKFFDEFHFQIGFYRAAINVRRHMMRHNMDYCMPLVGEKNILNFRELKELIMSIDQTGEVVGNTVNVNKKMLLVVTGANQGGKSTFLRSIGVAQVMMQSGMPVAAQSFQSGVYPEFFTHFTRREDSAMNSGRLDEELRRMDQIIEHVGENTMILLNESFASTTEKEGSEIAYDIIKALHEEGIKILTVTHLLSFAQKVYDENKKQESDVEFLSAQRLEDGTRTFKMVKHEPELTSFGLDLYKSMIEDKQTGQNIDK